MAKATFRQALAGLGKALPQIAATMYQYNVAKADEEYRNKQLALQERQVGAQEKIYEEQVKMSEFQRTVVADMELSLMELDKETKALANALQRKQNDNYDEDFTARMATTYKDIELKQAQIESLFSQANTDEERTQIMRQQYRLELQKNNVATMGMAHAMLKPEGFKTLQENYDKAQETDPNGVADWSQVLADTMMQNEGRNIFSSSEIEWMKVEMNTMASLYANYADNVMQQGDYLTSLALHNVNPQTGEPDNKGGKAARIMLTTESKATPNMIMEGGKNYVNVRIKDFNWATGWGQLGQFSGGLKFGSDTAAPTIILPTSGLKTELPDSIDENIYGQRKSLGTSVITGKEVYAPDPAAVSPGIRRKPYKTIEELNR